MAQSLDLIKVPKLRQATDYTCGVCALQAVLAYYGEDVREDTLSRALKANTRQGTGYREIAAYSRAHGYAVEIKKDAQLADLEAILKSRRPAICLIQAWADNKSTGAGENFDYSNDWQDGHYVVAIGFLTMTIFLFYGPVDSRHLYVHKAQGFFRALARHRWQ